MRRSESAVLFYVQHLLGIGHLKRAATLARAMEAEGMKVTIVSGGKDVPGLYIGGAEFVQIPAMRSRDEFFEVMLDDRDRPVDEALLHARRDLLLETVRRVRPAIVVTELFPFGRRSLRGEILPMIEAARALTPPAFIVSSVRDILVAPKKANRGPQMVEMARQYFDLILVHGDPDLIPFETTFPLAEEIADRLRYTGYVVDTPGGLRADTGAGRDEVIVSAGGGALSEPLLSAAISARPLTRLARNTWRLLAGPALPDEAFARLAAQAGDGIVLERARTDFPTLLANCRLSISQGGYNTVMDVLAAGARAVIAPYAGGKETEQTRRAGLLAARTSIQVVWEHELSAERLASAVEAALDAPRPDAAGIDTNGAAATARALAALLVRSGADA